MTVRVRFAPSPTGLFHVGGARSALQNWIFARQQGGAFVLRIEDTDASRNRPEWTDGIISALDWLGITHGSYEGPYFQSAYAAEQRTAADRLHAQGRAYYCDCTREDVVARTGNKHSGYDGHCRDRGLTEGPGRALRFRTPDEGVTVVRDLIRGEPTFDNAQLEDFVIARADGSAVFLLANVVDDITMGITHVIRAEEHLPNTPKQQLLWEALGIAPPVWAHVPVVVNEKRQKLSKRRDKVALEAYRAEGYLADAMRNYLMLLGWAPSGDREIVPWSVIEAEFRLEAVNPSPAFFDEKKLRAFNGEYIRALSVEEFIQACQPWLRGDSAAGAASGSGAAAGGGSTAGAASAGGPAGGGADGVGALIPPPPWKPADYDPAAFAAVAPLAQTRVAVLAEIVSNVDFLFLDAPAVDEAAWAKTMTDEGRALVADVVTAFEALPEWTVPRLKDAVEQAGAARGLKLGKAQAPVRLAVTGRTVGLPLFESIEVLGRDRTLERLRAVR